MSSKTLHLNNANNQTRGHRATGILAEWASSVTTTNIPHEVARHGRRLIVDYLAASCAGSTTELSEKLRRYFSYAEPGNRATVIAGPKLSASAAAYVNGAAAHGLELDDGYTAGSVHPGASVIPAVLAIAEATGASLDEATTSILVAVEVTVRIAEAGHPHVLHSGFHNTPVAGVFGAAAGVAHLLHAEPNTILSALGLAGSYAGGLREYHAQGSEVKRLHAGKAAGDGLKCGEMATLGISGPSTVLEGKEGYFAAFARGNWTPGVLLDNLGSEWSAMRTYVKPYPCCRHLHGAIDGALELRDLFKIDTAMISEIRVGTFELAARLGRSDPGSVLEAQLSLPYAVAAALRSGHVDLNTFDSRQINDPEIRRLSSLVHVYLDDSAQNSYPRERAADVQIIMKNGQIFQTRIAQPLGEPDNPISDESLNVKFRSLAVPVLGSQRVESALEQAWNGNDIHAITTALGQS